MGIDTNDPISLPQAPPPRPAARRGAIETALRKFDGIDEPHAAFRPTRFGWANAHRRPVGALVTAAIVAAISIPVVLVTLRDPPTASEIPPQSPPATVQPAQPGQPEFAPPPLEPQQQAEDIAAIEPPPAPAALAPPAAPARRNAMSLRSEEQKAIAGAPPPLVAAPPPPSPPPPAPAPQYAAEAEDANIVVSGSRIQAPAAKQSRREVVSDRVAGLSSDEDSALFLSRLQSALRANDRQSLKELIGFPLVVRLDGRVEIYRSWREVERDFDEIFTPRVRRSVLDLQPDQVVGRPESGTMGNAMLRFSPSCANRACSKAGPIRVREVNP